MKGYFYSYGDYVKKPVKDNVLLVGDAAGLIDAITGEGIYFALESGRQAALAICNGGGIDGVETGYRQSLGAIHKRIDEQKLCNKLVYAPFVKDMGMKLMQQHPGGVQRILENVIATYSGGYSIHWGRRFM